MRFKRHDRKNAESIIEAAEREMKFTLTLNISDDSATTIARNIYECFRMLGDAILISQGIESQDHVEAIKTLTKLEVKTTRPIQLIEGLRQLRHNINYYGYKPTMNELKDTISIAETCFKPLLKKVREIVEK
jgi:uncharacterized protein (UPF0332 family)